MSKLNLILVIFLFVGISCKTKKTVPTDENATSGKETNESSLEKLFSVSGFVTHSNSYCGGARPSDAMLNEITTPKPLANVTYYVRKGTMNNVNEKVVLSFTTDSLGKFEFQLPVGDYIIIEQNRLDSTYIKSVYKKFEKPSESYSPVDMKCLNKWLSESLFQFKVESDKIENITWDIHKACFTSDPCTHYNGPYPP